MEEFNIVYTSKPRLGDSRAIWRDKAHLSPDGKELRDVHSSTAQLSTESV